MRRYYALVLKTLDMGWLPEHSENPYGRYEVVLAPDFDALLADAKRLHEALSRELYLRGGSDLLDDFRERWLQEDIDGE